MLEKIKAVMIGHAVGDALGVPVEFADREELTDAPVTQMEGYGTYPYPAGTWSDDTSMSLAALDSLGKGKIDWEEIMENFYQWYTEGKYTATGETFDIGQSCMEALLKYSVMEGKATECGGASENSNGNGSLMRIHPFTLFIEYCKCSGDWQDIIYNASALTHAHPRCKIACGIYTVIMHRLLENPTKESLLQGLSDAEGKYRNHPEFHHYKRIFQPNFKDLPNQEIESTGYVVHTLEAALWCLMTTDNYKDCVLKAVNLGEDTDTVAAIAGGMAGALYGYDAIPKEWRDTLLKRDYIEDMCNSAYSTWKQPKNNM